ncbi:hypothetical protein V3C99_006814, partial [Haemonchus contortus]
CTQRSSADKVTTMAYLKPDYPKYLQFECTNR